MLIGRVDQLCQFIADNGLQPPSTPQDKDAALKEILDALGPAKPTLTFEQRPVCEEQLSPIISSDPILELAKPQNVMGPPPLPGTIALPKNPAVNSPDHPTGTSLLPTASNDAPLSVISLEQNESSPSADTPESILSNWDLDLSFGGSPAPAPTDLHQFIESTSQSDALGLGLGEIPQSAEVAATSEDGSTLVGEADTTADIEGLIDELSDRVGTLRIGRGGKTHFFGPTSTFNLRDMPHSDNFDSHRRVHGYDLHNPDRVDADREVPPALEEHLINLYFSWQDPSFHVVDRKMYEGAKEKWFAMEDTSFYSEALRNAM